MAEVVGVVVGVVSLGVQLAESLQKVKRFYATVKDAPERLADIIDEIGSLSDILTELEQHPTSSGANTGPAMQRCVAACRKAVDRFSTFANSLESRIKRSRGLGSVKFAMRNESIESVIASLESSKSNLVLAYMIYRETICDQRARLLQDQMNLFASGQALLLQQRETPQDAQTTTDKRPEMQSYRRSYVRPQPILKTPTWLSHTVWEMAVDRAISGWTFSLRSYRWLDFHNSPVVHACQRGDIARLQLFFDRGEASPFDEITVVTDFKSLLDVAVAFNQMEIPRLLIRYGTTSLSKLAMFVAISSVPHGEPPSLKTMTVQRDWFRFLAEECELDWTGVEALSGDVAWMASIYAFVYGSIEESTAAFFWIKIAKPETLCYPGFNLDVVALNNDTTYLLKYRNLHVGTTQLSSLALAYITSAFHGPDSASNKRRLQELLVGWIELGHDLHGSSDGISPLISVLHYYRYTVPCVSGMEARLNDWLTLLKNTGVDLRLYGQEEWHRFQALRRNCDRPWDWGHGVEAHRCEEDSYDIFGRSESLPALATFTYGEEVSDWKLWVLHPGDEYAGKFWRLIEQNGIYDRHVPGGWVEDG